MDEGAFRAFDKLTTLEVANNAWLRNAYNSTSNHFNHLHILQITLLLLVSGFTIPSFPYAILSSSFMNLAASAERLDDQSFPKTSKVRLSTSTPLTDSHPLTLIN